MTELTVARLEQWRAVQPQGRRGVAVPVGLWVLLVVLATALTPEGGCTPASVCGPDWSGAVEVALALSAPVLLLWVPAVGSVVSVVAAVVFAYGEHVVGVLPWPVRVVLPVLVVAATVEADVRRRLRDARSRALLDGLPVRVFPGPQPQVRPWPWKTVAGAGCVAVGAVLLVYGVLHGRTVAEQEARARHVTGTVVKHGDDGYLVTVAFDDRQAVVDTMRADDYPVGSRQELLVGEELGVRLAVERYDPAGWLFGALLVGAFGLVLAGRGRAERDGARRLLSAPQPVHQVRVGWSPKGGQVLPLHGEAAPLLALPVVVADPDALPDVEGYEPPDVEEAELYGVPRAGEQCALVLADGTRLLPAARARRGRPDWREQLVDVDPDAWSAAPDEERPADGADGGPPVATAAEVEVWRQELTRPERWRAPLGVVLVGGALVGAYLVAKHADSLFTTLWRCAIAASFAFDGLVHLVTRVRLTSEGLVHDGPTTRRTVPWRAVQRLTVVEGDGVLAWLDDGEVLPLTWLPHRPRFGGKARRHAWARRWAAVLAAQVRDAPSVPDTRARTEPRLHAAVVALAFTGAVLLGLWSRGQV